jgi:hypothetical protein
MPLFHLGRALDPVLVSSMHPFPKTDACKLISACRLAYCEVYVMLGTLLRRFPSLKANDLKPEDMVIDDYFGGHYPVDAPKLHVWSPRA